MPVGVLVPVGGFAPYLAEALDAVLAERPAVVVVADDAADPPVALHPDHADRVVLVRRERRGGPAAARATALASLPETVDLVALCDADDAWTAGSLAPRVAALERHPGAAVAFGRALVVGPDGRPTGERWAAVAAGVHPAAAFARELFAANPVPASSAVVRRAALEAAGGFAAPAPLAEDWDLWLRLAAAGGDAACVPEVAVRYRRHAGGLTADVTALAAAQRAVRARHAALVPAAERRRAAAADLRALAAGLARDGRFAEARAALRDAAALARPDRRDRVLAAALALPAVRGLVGRRDPYRR